MFVELIQALVLAFEVYAVVGMLFAVAFVARGARAIDRVAEDGTLGFRLLILPGAAALWPLLLVRWLRASGEPPEEQSPHRRLAAEQRRQP